ncbi:hypothetical protein SUNI508_13903 [Seiridium unicorne]|uniref:NAD(P)-binding protein n=1 Tax=Seiridium unicorne TaxID=138068 RepID=A0ABR2VB29_9PEZI
MAASNKDIVFITGENTGLGVEIARKLLREHADRFHVIIGSRTLAKGNAAVDGLKAEGFDGTVTERHGRVNVLHVNAGIALDLNYTDRKEWPLSRLLMTSMETNVAGAAATVETFVPLLEKAENPRVVFMTSGAGSVQLAHDHVVLSLNWPSYRATNLSNFGKGSPGGVPPGPVEDGAVERCQTLIAGKIWREGDIYATCWKRRPRGDSLVITRWFGVRHTRRSADEQAGVIMYSHDSFSRSVWYWDVLAWRDRLFTARKQAGI